MWDVPDSKAEGREYANRDQTVNMDFAKILLAWIVTAFVTAAAIVLLGLKQSPRAETPDSADDKMD